MQRYRFFRGTVFFHGTASGVVSGIVLGVTVVALIGTPARPSRAQSPADLDARDKTELFIQHIVKVARIDPARYQALVLEYEIGTALGEILDAHGSGHEGDGGHGEPAGVGPVAAGTHEAHEDLGLVADDFIERALREIHPAYDDLARTLEEGRLEDARAKARELKGAADPYVSAHAALALAEAEFADLGAKDDSGEDAWQDLVRRCEDIAERSRLYLVRDHRACELVALAFQKLKKPLLEFVQYAILLTDYKSLPAETTARARARLAALAGEVGWPLGTVADWMNEVEKLLAEEVTRPDPTQRRETEIVYALDKLIELQEARERNTCPGCGSSPCNGSCRGGRPQGNRSTSPARVSALAEAKGEILLRGVSRGDASTIWGQLKEKDAARAMQSFKGQLPPRYEKLLEQYYKNLSKVE